MPRQASPYADGTPVASRRWSLQADQLREETAMRPVPCLLAAAALLSAAPVMAQHMTNGDVDRATASWGTMSQLELFDAHQEMARTVNAACDDLGGTGAPGARQAADLRADELDPCVVRALDSQVIQTGDTGMVLVHMSLPANVRYSIDRPLSFRKQAMDGDLVQIRDRQDRPFGWGMK